MRIVDRNRPLFSFQRLFVPALVGLVALPVEVRAAQYDVTGALYSVDETAHSTYYRDYSDSSASPVSNGFVVSTSPPDPLDLVVGGTSNAAADAGGAHASASISIGRRAYYPNSTGSLTFVSNADARATYSDFVLTGPAGTPLSIRCNVRLDGAQSASLVDFGDPLAGSLGVISQVSVALYANSAEALYAGHGIQYLVGSPDRSYGVGGLENFTGGTATLKSGAFTVTPGTPFTLALELSASGQASLADAGRGTLAASANFDHTLSFATDAPVFDLPDGYTVNSPSAHIVNNYYINPVPEPAPFAALGLGALTLLRRRSRKP